MLKLNFTYRKLTVALAIVALAFLQTLHPTTSARPLPRAAAADLTTEKLTLTSFGDGLSSFEKNVSTLQSKLSITSTELNSTKASASTLKTKISSTQQAFQSVINKLKAAGEWENYDDVILRRITDERVRQLIIEDGGPRKVLEYAATQLSGLSIEIDELVQPLSTKVASTGFSFGHSRALGFVPARAAYARTATLFRKTLRCRFREAVNQVNPSQDAADKQVCACYDNLDAASRAMFHCD